MPAASVAVAVKLWPPSGNTTVVKVHAPVPSAVAVPGGVAPSKYITVLLASAVPVSVGVDIIGEPTIGHRAGHLRDPLVMVLMAGAPGAVASTVTPGADRTDFYAASIQRGGRDCGKNESPITKAKGGNRKNAGRRFS